MKYVIGVLLILIVSLGFTQVLDNLDNKKLTSEENLHERYKGLVLMKLAPSSEPREATELDRDTGIVFYKSEAEKYKLYESRDITREDFGKSFLSRV